MNYQINELLYAINYSILIVNNIKSKMILKYYFIKKVKFEFLTKSILENK